MVDFTEFNCRRLELRSGGILTLSCTNLFAMLKPDRDFVLKLLQLEAYEADPSDKTAAAIGRRA